MKFGLRKPSLKHSLKARTTGRAKRAVKKTLIPGYGKKAWDGLRILKKQHITRYIIKHRLVFGIYLNKKSPIRRPKLLTVVLVCI